MKALVLVGTALAALAIGGCQKVNEQPPVGVSGGRGRYVGVGIYSPGQMWRQLDRPDVTSANPAVATLDDDEQVIVLLDSATGELRQCGNLSGHCIGFNPWSKRLAEEQGLPAAVLKHAEQLAAEAQTSPMATPR